jgi:hypothetical protein
LNVSSSKLFLPSKLLIHGAYSLILLVLVSVLFSGCEGIKLPFFSQGDESAEGGKEIAMIESPPDIPPCPPPRPNLPVEPALDGDLPVTPSGLDAAGLDTSDSVAEPPAQSEVLPASSGSASSAAQTSEGLPAQSGRLPTLPKNPKQNATSKTSTTTSNSVEIKPGGLDAPPRPVETGGSKSSPTLPTKASSNNPPPTKPPVDLGPAGQTVPKKKPIANDDPLEPKLEPIIFDEGDDKDDEGGYVKVETLQKPGKSQRIETRTTP